MVAERALPPLLEHAQPVEQRDPEPTVPVAETNLQRPVEPSRNGIGLEIIHFPKRKRPLFSD